MARDYKNTAKKRKPARKPVPGWLWLLTGLAIGLLGMVVMYLRGQHPQTPTHTVIATPAKPAAAKPTEKKDKQAKATKPGGTATSGNGVRYEFYTLLPESEVVVPDRELAEHDKPGTGKTPPAATGNYMLQAGSFRHEPEARTLKGELALLGVDADIQSVTIGSDTWYRVRVGPFSTLEDLNRVRDRLQKNNINAIPVRVKKG